MEKTSEKVLQPQLNISRKKTVSENKNISNTIRNALRWVCHFPYFLLFRATNAERTIIPKLKHSEMCSEPKLLPGAHE